MKRAFSFIAILAIIIVYSSFELEESFIKPSTKRTNVTYTLGSLDDLQRIYPDPSWLPEQYKQYYTSDIYSTIELYTTISLNNDGIKDAKVTVQIAKNSKDVNVSISASDPSVKDYKYMHPRFIQNYKQALKGVNFCKSLGTSCWNNAGIQKNEPWAFFPQFGLPLVNQKSILLLNYPPYTALTKKSYLKTFTINRWSRVARAVGNPNPTLFETIVDTRPIAASGSGVSDSLPDPEKYFNDKTGTHGGYYINPQLSLMLDPPGNTSKTHTLPLVVLGGPAREFWSNMVGIKDTLLATGTFQVPGSKKITPYILGNHPDVTTYQTCKSPQELIHDEQIDLQVLSWQLEMSKDPSQDPSEVLNTVHKKWVTDLSTEDKTKICVEAKQDIYSNPSTTLKEAKEFCYCNYDNPCGTKDCDKKD